MTIFHETKKKTAAKCFEALFILLGICTQKKLKNCTETSEKSLKIEKKTYFLVSVWVC